MMVIIHINSSKNCAAVAPISSYSASPEESEVLIAPYMLFKILKIKHDEELDLKFLKSWGVGNIKDIQY